MAARNMKAQGGEGVYGMRRSAIGGQLRTESVLVERVQMALVRQTAVCDVYVEEGCLT